MSDVPAFYTHVQQLGDKIVARGYDENGRRAVSEVEYKPYLFVSSPTGKPDKVTLIGSKPLRRLEFSSISDARDWQEKYRDVSQMEWHGMNEWVYVFISDSWQGEVPYNQSLIRVGYLDIEVDTENGYPNMDSADKAVTAISVELNGTTHMFVLGEYVAASDESVSCFTREKDLLAAFIGWWRSAACDLDVVSGWNIEGFDIPYLYRRISNVVGTSYANKLSPLGRTREKTLKNKFGGEYTTYALAGIAVLDYLALYQKFTYKQRPSYKLDDIAEYELGENKVDYKALGYASLADLYKRNPQLYFEYNAKDSKLVRRLDDKLGFIAQACAIAYMAKVNLADAMTSVLLWDVIAFNNLSSRGIAVPRKRGFSKDNAIVGAYVKEVVPGKYRWGVSVDLTSLYPHLIMGYNISPETYVGLNDWASGLMTVNSVRDILEKSFQASMELESCRSQGLGMTPNGALFDNSKTGFLSSLMSDMFEGRKAAKNKMIAAKQRIQESKANGQTVDPKDADEVVKFNNLQMALKIALNSLYGALSNVAFRYFAVELAEAVTTSGQLAIQWAEKVVNERLNSLAKAGQKIDFVIASDTDSLYVDVSRFVDSFCRKNELVNSPESPDINKIIDFIDTLQERVIQPAIDAGYEDMREYTNAKEQKMFMKREAIFSAGVWTAKKRYALLVHDNEGVRFAEPELKVMGLDAVRSSIPPFCQAALIDCYRISLLKGEAELQAKVASFKSEFSSMPFIDIALVSSAKFENGAAETDKGCTKQARAALVYNRMIREKQVDHLYPRIHSGDKIKFVDLKMPNPAKSVVVGALNQLPVEFGLEKYINVDSQFQRVFLGALENYLSALGWHAEPVSTLDFLFG